MATTKSLKELHKTVESLPVFVVLDSLYAKNANSPVAASKTASQNYSELVGRVKKALHEDMNIETISDARSLPFTTLFSLAEMIVYANTKNPEIFLQVMNPEYSDDFLACHSLNVAFISSKVGMGMGLKYKELSEICVASLLHDIGMTRIDAECYNHERDLSRRERNVVNSHPNLGWEFFKKLEHDFPWLLNVILGEHKREGGKGYPEGVEGDLHLYTKIIGVCDSLEALSHQRVHRKAFHPADVMKTIIKAKEYLFAKDILHAVIESLSMYPVGSLVQLNSKKIARVIEPIYGSPLRPAVRVVDNDGEAADESDMTTDLSNNSNLYITGLVYSEQYQVPEKLAVS